MDWTKLYSIPLDLVRQWSHVLLAGITIQLYLQLLTHSFYHEQGHQSLSLDIQLIFLAIATFNAIKITRHGANRQSQLARPLSRLILIAKWITIFVWICGTLSVLIFFVDNFQRNSRQFIGDHEERLFAPLLTFMCFVLVGLYQDQLLAAVLSALAYLVFCSFPWFNIAKRLIVEGLIHRPLPWIATHICMLGILLIIIGYAIALYQAQPGKIESEIELEPQPMEEINQDKPETYVTLVNESIEQTQN